MSADVLAQAQPPRRAAVAQAKALFATFAKDAGDFAGAYTASAGDVDGDGFVDLTIGAYGVDLADYNEGAVYLAYGPFPAGTLALADAATRWVGMADGAVAGSAVAGGADADGDGWTDYDVTRIACDAPGGFLAMTDSED